MRVYLDSHIVISFVEQPPAWGSQAAARRADYRARKAELATSGLARTECKVGPLISADATPIANFDALFGSLFPRVFALTTQVCEPAAPIRAASRFETPDALHQAAAVESGCDLETIAKGDWLGAVCRRILENRCSRAGACPLLGCRPMTRGSRNSRH